MATKQPLAEKGHEIGEEIPYGLDLKSVRRILTAAATKSIKNSIDSTHEQTQRLAAPGKPAKAIVRVIVLIIPGQPQLKFGDELQ